MWIESAKQVADLFEKLKDNDLELPSSEEPPYSHAPNLLDPRRKCMSIALDNLFMLPAVFSILDLTKDTFITGTIKNRYSEEICTAHVLLLQSYCRSR